MVTKKTRKRAAKPKAAEKEPVVVTDSEPVGVATLSFGSQKVMDGDPLIDLPADGTLLRMDGAPAVFVMRDGQRRPFASAEAFTACGFGWNEIVVLPPKEIVPIPVGPEVVRASDL